MARRKMITIFLDPGKTVYESSELVVLREGGWSVDMIIPQGENDEGRLRIEVYLSLSE